MKRLLLSVLPALALGGAGSVRAQAPPGSIQVGYDGGRLYGGTLAKGASRNFNRSVEMDDDISTGFCLGAQITGLWGLELSQRRASTHWVVPDPGVFAYQPAVAVVNVSTVEALALRRYPMGHFHPYYAFGLGVETLDTRMPDPAPSIREPRRASFTGGVGARFWMTPWLALRFDVRTHFAYLAGNPQGPDQGLSGPGRWLRTQEAVVGGAVSF